MINSSNQKDVVIEAGKTLLKLVSKIPFNSVIGLILFGLVGYFIGALILFHEYLFCKLSCEELKGIPICIKVFNVYPDLLVWVFLVLVQTTVWLPFLIVMVSGLIYIQREFKVSTKEIICIFFLYSCS